MRWMAEDGKRARRRGLGGWKKRVSTSGPDAAAEGSGPEQCGVSLELGTWRSGPGQSFGSVRD